MITSQYTAIENLDHIHIFKTNITENAILKLRTVLDHNKQLLSWSVDTEDCDAVLRVVSIDLSEETIQGIIIQSGFICEPLS